MDLQRKCLPKAGLDIKNRINADNTVCIDCGNDFCEE